MSDIGLPALVSSESSRETGPRPSSLSATSSGQDPVHLKPGIPKFQNPKFGTGAPFPLGSLQLGPCPADIQERNPHHWGSSRPWALCPQQPQPGSPWRPWSPVPAPGHMLTVAQGLIHGSYGGPAEGPLNDLPQGAGPLLLLPWLLEGAGGTLLTTFSWGPGCARPHERLFLSHKVNREQRREVSQPWSLPQTHRSASRRGGSRLLSPLFIE